MFRHLFLGAAGVVLGVSIAAAHVTLETRQAAIGSGYKAVLRVPHGCDGSATTAIRVRIPPGIIDVKPMPKPGWTLATVRGRYAKPTSLHGAQVTEGVTEVDWTAGKLPDGFYDEFVFIAVIGDELEAGETVYFPVVQECEKGIHRWIDMPAAGAHDGHGGEAAQPAPGLQLLPRK